MISFGAAAVPFLLQQPSPFLAVFLSKGPYSTIPSNYIPFGYHQNIMLIIIKQNTAQLDFAAPSRPKDGVRWTRSVYACSWRCSFDSCLSQQKSGVGGGGGGVIIDVRLTVTSDRRGCDSTTFGLEKRVSLGGRGWAVTMFNVWHHCLHRRTLLIDYCKILIHHRLSQHSILVLAFALTSTRIYQLLVLFTIYARYSARNLFVNPYQTMLSTIVHSYRTEGICVCYSSLLPLMRAAVNRRCSQLLRQWYTHSHDETTLLCYYSGYVNAMPMFRLVNHEQRNTRYKFVQFLIVRTSAALPYKSLGEFVMWVFHFSRV